MRWVTEATYLGGYKLKVRFDNGESKVVDLQAHLDGTIFEPLKDLDFFKSFSVNQDLNTVLYDRTMPTSHRISFMRSAGKSVNKTRQ